MSITFQTKTIALQAELFWSTWGLTLDTFSSHFPDSYAFELHLGPLYVEFDYSSLKYQQDLNNFWTGDAP